MLLCPVPKLTPGMVVAASVVHPNCQQRELLRPGVALDAALIKRLSSTGVKTVWINHDITADLNVVLPEKISDMQRTVCNRLKKDLGRVTGKTAVDLPVAQYRQIMLDLIERMMRIPAFASFSAQMMEADDDLFSHCAETGIFCVMIAGRMENYIVAQRTGLDPKQARDLVAPGLAGMLHDLGKMLEDDDDLRHAKHIDAAWDPEALPDGYEKHVVTGYAALRNTPLPASARQAILNHHQRFDGRGFPDLGPLTSGRTTGTQCGNKIHIFARILGAANALTHMMADAEHSPPVVGLSRFLSPELDGWFDPQIRHTIGSQIPPFPVGMLVQLSDGTEAAVATPNTTQPCRPVVKRLDGDSAGQMIDLAEDDRAALHIVEAGGEPVAEHLFDLTAVLKRETTMLKQVFSRPPVASADTVPVTG